MNWKEVLKKLEREQFWDEAIEYMQKIIDQYPNDLDAYLAINYLIMNILVEEDYDETKHDYYASLLKQYFDESWEKFSNNAEYLFFIGYISVMSPWYFGLDWEDPEKLLMKSFDIDNLNILYKWVIYSKKSFHDFNKKKEYAKLILKDNSPIKIKLKEKGSLGDRILLYMHMWAKEF